MAKPAKTKKNQAAAAPSKKGGENAAEKVSAKGKGKVVPAKSKAKKQETGGLKSRLGKTQASKSKPSRAAAGKDKRNAGKFLREVRLELSKVTWPSREELIQSTIVVLVAVVIAGVYIAFFDEIFSRLINMLASAGN